MAMVTCMCISKPSPLTVHFVALNEILVLLQATSRIRDVRPDVLIQVPAEVLIVHHEQQSILVVSWAISMYVQSSYNEDDTLG